MDCQPYPWWHKHPHYTTKQTPRGSVAVLVQPFGEVLLTDEMSEEDAAALVLHLNDTSIDKRIIQC